MIRALIVTNELKIIDDVPLNRLSDADVKWFWVDFDAPTDEEVNLLATHFNFHALAVEDCLHFLQRPKLDYYEGYDFFVLNTLNQDLLTPEEIDVFVGSHSIVTFHFSPSRQIEMVRKRLMENENII